MFFFERDLTGMEVKCGPVDVQDIVETVLQQTPETDVKRVARPPRGERYPRVLGDDVRLTFCIESILSYLLRVAPQESNIGVTVDRDRAFLVIRLFIEDLKVAPTQLDDQNRTDWLGAAWCELASGLSTVRKLAELQCGKLFGPEFWHRGWGFRLELAIAP